MGKEEDVEQERKHYESETVWNARKAFLLAHWDDYKEADRDRLECYSQLFININMIGCMYSPELMSKIKEMGAGIMEKANKLNNERQFVYASRGRAEAAAVKKKEEAAREQEKKAVARESGLMPQLRQLRAHMMQAAQTATPEDLMRMVDRVQLRYHVDSCADGTCVLRIRNFVVFKHKFHQKFNIQKEVIRSVTDSFLHCDPSVSDKEQTIIFSDVPISEMYRTALQRRLVMAARQLGAANDFNALSKVFQAIGLELKQTSRQLQGWSQEMELRAGELLVATKVLGKNESVKAKLQAAVDQMCLPICEAIRKATLKLTDSDNGLVIVL